MKRIALILEGGGMRGVYTAGALDLFLDEGIYIEPIYAVSAGACHACSYLSRQRGRAIKTQTQFIRDKNYASFRSLLRTGDYFNEQMVYRDVPDTLLPYDYDAYIRYGAEFYAVLTDIETGEAVYHRVMDLRKDVRAIQASSSLPLLSRPVVIDGRTYLDGGMADSIPLKKSIEDGNTKNLVILTRHKGYRKQKDSSMPLIKLKYRKHKDLVKGMEARREGYNAALDLVESEEKAGRAIVIRPGAPVTIGRLEKNVDALMCLYQDGYEDAKKALPALYRWLGE